MNDYSNFTIYVDESGDHSLTNIDPKYPLFVLAFCVATKEDYRTQIAPEITHFKHRWLGHEAAILHAHDIRKKKGGFKFLLDQAVQEPFINDLTILVDKLPYTLIASVIDKKQLTQTYPTPNNPYSTAMRFCLERTSHYLREQGESDKQTHVLVESRGRKEDAELKIAFRRICDGDNSLKFHQKLPFEVVFVDKKQNLPGLQLADLVCQPIGHHQFKPEQRNRAYDIVKKKFRRGKNGKVEGYGLKIFP